MEKGNWICKVCVWCCPRIELGSPALHHCGTIMQICTIHVKSSSVATTVEGECFSWMAEKKPEHKCQCIVLLAHIRNVHKAQ